MGSLYGEGKGEGVWVLYKGKRCWLSDISQEIFKGMKKRETDLEDLTFSIEKDGEDFSAPLNQLELAEPE